MKVLIIDNYDSFVYNLVQLIGSLNTETYVYRNNKIKSDEIKKINPDRIVISPGPGNPKNPGLSGFSGLIIQKLILQKLIGLIMVSGSTQPDSTQLFCSGSEVRGPR